MIPLDLKYTEDHEWVRINDDGTALIGITDHATEELGEVVYLELPDEGDEVEQGSEFGSVESVKSLSSLFSPISGEVTQINSDVVDQPALLSDSPYEDGWLIKVRCADSDELDDLKNTYSGSNKKSQEVFVQIQSFFSIFVIIIIVGFSFKYLKSDKIIS